jgi:hypothetical protein
MAAKNAKQEPIYLPPQLNIDVELDGNRVVHLARPGAFVEKYDVRVVKRDGFKGQLIEGPEIRSLVVARGTPPPGIAHEAVATPRGILLHSAEDYDRVRSRISWLIPAAPPLPANPDDWEALCGRVRDSWRGRFSFAEEEVDSAGRVVATGLRPPQIGGIHAALAHWKASGEPATIVMPTGTGKTETMLALLAHERFERLLVVVPTNALRTQTVAKFRTFGLLKILGVLGPDAQYPVVGTVETVLPSAAAVTELFQRCNVLVATMAALTPCGDFIKQRIAELTSHLFIDEVPIFRRIGPRVFRSFPPRGSRRVTGCF